MEQYFILFLLVLGVNLLPAFGPPTWSILVVFRLNSDMPTWAIVIIGATAAAAGRYLLAWGFWLLRKRLSERSRRNLEAAREALERRKRNTIIALGLFAVSPVPSAQLFEAAGLAGVRLLGFTAAFFLGRLLSYTIYTYTAGKIRDTSMGQALQGGFSNPWIIALQVALIAFLVLMTRIDWAKLLNQKEQGRSAAASD